jgi:hypothetical protein
MYGDAETNHEEDAAGVERQVIYAVPGEGGLSVITFVADTEHEAVLGRVAEASMKTLNVRPPSSSLSPKRSRAYLLGYYAGAFGVPLMGLAALVGLGVVKLFRGRSRKSKPR